MLIGVRELRFPHRAKDATPQPDSVGAPHPLTAW